MAAMLLLPLAALLAFNLPPSATFLNQAVALVTWGGWLLVTAPLAERLALRGGIASLQIAFGLVALSALASSSFTHLPWSLSLSAVGLVAAAAVVAQTGASLSGATARTTAFRAFALSLLVAGAVSSGVGLIQVFAPTWADGNWIARTYIEGRAVGNMRQPNHLSSLLLWSIVAAVWLGEARALKRSGSTLLALLFIFVVVLSASRTGALSMALLLLWGALDKRLSRHARLLLILAPLIYGLFWYGTGVWADATRHVFGGETRFSTKGDVSSSRLAIWSNTLALIRMHPWAGVGFGEFNFAWTLTPFPDRPVAFFDHTHNIVLQFLVELGIPLGLLVLGLLLYALVVAFRHARQPVSESAAPGEALLRPAAFMMVLLILLHSLLEYPLWYAYYLLPAAFAFGLCLAEPGAPPPPAAVPARGLRPLVVASLLLMMGGIASVADYSRVVVIFAPGEGAPALAQRILDGRKSLFFAHHADYAAATTSEYPGHVMPAFVRAPHYLLDARLLQAWATALEQAGDTQRARYLAQRLREFHNEQSVPFFAPCAAPPAADKIVPFQCVPPARTFSYEDFR